MIRPRFFLIVLLCTAACNLPRDADDTLERVRGGVLRVGYTENPPWITDTAGVERKLVNELAASLGARVEWVRSSESRLMEEIHQRKLDLVVAGLTLDGTWITRAAPTKPFFVDATQKKEHAWAVPPGENAWLVHVERFLIPRKDRIPGLLAREAQ